MDILTGVSPSVCVAGCLAVCLSVCLSLYPDDPVSTTLSRIFTSDTVYSGSDATPEDGKQFLRQTSLLIHQLPKSRDLYKQLKHTKYTLVYVFVPRQMDRWSEYREQRIFPFPFFLFFLTFRSFWSDHEQISSPILCTLR